MPFVDPYFDESIGELRTLLDVKSAEELYEREPQIVFANEAELESVGIPVSAPSFAAHHHGACSIS